jgi:hypothetical protein
MILITKKLAEKLPAVEEPKKQKNPIAYIKVFNPYGVGTWYICGKTGDLLYGLVELQGNPISELTGKKVAI